MTSNPDHISMTGPETAALAPYLTELHPVDIQIILRTARNRGRAAHNRRRRGEAERLHVNRLKPAALDAYLRGIADMGAIQYRRRVPQDRGGEGGMVTDAEYAAAATGYGETFLAATKALLAIYLGNEATAEAALAALDDLDKALIEAGIVDATWACPVRLESAAASSCHRAQRPPIRAQCVRLSASRPLWVPVPEVEVQVPGLAQYSPSKELIDGPQSRDRPDLGTRSAV